VKQYTLPAAAVGELIADRSDINSNNLNGCDGHDFILIIKEY